GPLTQSFVDVYSWNIFLAMNWPASTGNCSADATKSILNVKSGDGTFVTWQTYMPSDNVFVNPGYQKPAAWCSGNGLAAGANRLFTHEAKSVAAAKKLGGMFLKVAEPGGDVLQASGDVVTDQAGRWLRYERLMNKVEYDYMAADHWNAVQLQAMFKAKPPVPIRIPEGAVEIKSAWKVLTPAEISGNRYFTTTGTVCNTPDGARTPCDDKPVTFGLVGLHIVQQTNDGGTMFWSTFEQNDNETVFFDPTSKSPVNTDLAKAPYTELDKSCKAINQPTQIKRVTPIPASPDLNKYYQQLLAGSVFANYRLISTQWTTGLGRGGGLRGRNRRGSAHTEPMAILHRLRAKRRLDDHRRRRSSRRPNGRRLLGSLRTCGQRKSDKTHHERSNRQTIHKAIPFAKESVFGGSSLPGEIHISFRVMRPPQAPRGSVGRRASRRDVRHTREWPAVPGQVRA
ncbi:MAG: hypothetical protein ABI837_11030, partial [Acidobacteriota bacterium]